MQKRIYWNDGWKFKETYENQMRETAYQDDAWEDVRLPHTCKETPFHYFDESSYQMVCCYRKHFFALEEWKDQTVIVTFEGIAHEAQVFLNGERIGEHHCRLHGIFHRYQQKTANRGRKCAYSAGG